MCWAGLSLGDVPSRQPIGIVLTVLGVVVLDFSADATEGPIRAYLLDVVDSEEQDMALNIHAFSAGESAALPPPHPARGRTRSMREAVPMALFPTSGGEQPPLTTPCAQAPFSSAGSGSFLSLRDDGPRCPESRASLRFLSWQIAAPDALDGSL